jgi:hypothetical protein
MLPGALFVDIFNQSSSCSLKIDSAASTIPILKLNHGWEWFHHHKGSNKLIVMKPL